MKSDQIRELLEKYYQGTTSLKEEKQLRDQFVSGDYPPEFSVEAGPFLCFAKAAKERIPDPELDREIEKLLRSLPASVARRRKKRIPWMVAASVLLLGGLVFSLRHINPRGVETASITNPQAAYAQVFNLMQSLSGKLDTPFAEANCLNRLNTRSNSLASISNLYTVQKFNNHPDESRSIN